MAIAARVVRAGCDPKKITTSAAAARAAYTQGNPILGCAHLGRLAYSRGQMQHSTGGDETAAWRLCRGGAM